MTGTASPPLTTPNPATHADRRRFDRLGQGSLEPDQCAGREDFVGEAVRASDGARGPSAFAGC
jgi:hypothetical protein